MPDDQPTDADPPSAAGPMDLDALTVADIVALQSAEEHGHYVAYPRPGSLLDQLGAALQEVDRWRAELDEAQLRSIEARNPGIDMDEVRRVRGTRSSTSPRPVPSPETIARAFHETYERLAPSFGYETRKASAVPWDDVPDQNKRLMIAVAGEVLRALVGGPDPYERAGMAGVIAAYLANTDLIPTGDDWEQRCEDVATEIVAELRAAGALVGGRPAAPTRMEVREAIALAYIRCADQLPGMDSEQLHHLADTALLLLPRSAAEPTECPVSATADGCHCVCERDACCWCGVARPPTVVPLPVDVGVAAEPAEAKAKVAALFEHLEEDIRPLLDSDRCMGCGLVSGLSEDGHRKICPLAWLRMWAGVANEEPGDD